MASNHPERQRLPEGMQTVLGILGRLKTEPVETINSLIDHLLETHTAQQIAEMVKNCSKAMGGDSPFGFPAMAMAGMPTDSPQDPSHGSPARSNKGKGGEEDKGDEHKKGKDDEEDKDESSDTKSSGLEVDVWPRLLTILKKSGNPEQIKLLPASLPNSVGRVIQTVMIWLSMIATWGLASKHMPRFLNKIGLEGVDAATAVGVFFLTVWVSMCSESITERLVENIRNVEAKWPLNTAGKGRKVNVTSLPIGFLKTLWHYVYTAPKEVVVGTASALGGGISNTVTKGEGKGDGIPRAAQGACLITAIVLGGWANYKGQIDQIRNALLEGQPVEKTMKIRGEKLDVANPASPAANLMANVQRDAVDQMGEITARRYADEIGVPRNSIVYDKTTQEIYYRTPAGKQVRVEMSDPSNRADQLGIPAVPNATGSGRRGKERVATGLLRRFEQAKTEVEGSASGSTSAAVESFRASLQRILVEHKQETDTTVEIPMVGEIDFGKVYRFFQLSGSSKESVFAAANRKFTNETDPRIKEEMQRLYQGITTAWQASDSQIEALENEVAGGRRKDVPFERFTPPVPDTSEFKKLPEDMESFFTMDAKQVLDEYGPEGLLLLGLMVIAFVTLSECLAKAGVMPNWHYFWLYTIWRNLRIGGLKVKRAALRATAKKDDPAAEEALEKIEMKIETLREEIQEYEPPLDLVNPVRNTVLRLCVGQTVAHEREAEHLPGVIEGTENSLQETVEGISDFLEPVRAAAERLGFHLVPQHLDPEYMQHVATQRIDRMIAPLGHGNIMRATHNAILHPGGLIGDVLTANSLRAEEHDIANQRARRLRKAKAGGWWKGEAWWRLRTKEASRYFLHAFIPGGHKLGNVTPEQLAARLEFWLQCKEWDTNVDIAMDRKEMKKVIDHMSSEHAAVLRPIGNTVFPKAFDGPTKEQSDADLLGYKAWRKVRDKHAEGKVDAKPESIVGAIGKGLAAKARKPFQAARAALAAWRAGLADSVEHAREATGEWANKQAENADQATQQKMVDALEIVMDAADGQEVDHAKLKHAHSYIKGCMGTGNPSVQRLWNNFIEQLVDSQDGQSELGESVEEVQENIETMLNNVHDILYPSGQRSGPSRFSLPRTPKAHSRDKAQPEAKPDTTWRERNELRGRPDVVQAIESLADFDGNGIAPQDIPEFDTASETIVNVHEGKDHWLKIAVGLAWERMRGTDEGKGWENLAETRNRLLDRVNELESQQKESPTIYRGAEEEKRQEQLEEKLQEVRGSPPKPKILPAVRQQVGQPQDQIKPRFREMGTPGAAWETQTAKQFGTVERKDMTEDKIGWAVYQVDHIQVISERTRDDARKALLILRYAFDHLDQSQKAIDDVLINRDQKGTMRKLAAIGKQYTDEVLDKMAEKLAQKTGKLLYLVQEDYDPSSVAPRSESYLLSRKKRK